MSNVRSAPIGFVPASGVERAFIGLLYTLVLLLSFLSVLGTFYGLRGSAAPLNLGVLWSDISGDAGGFGLALLWQSTLTVAQWGAHQMAKRRDHRWWLAYLAVLGLSVYYNVVAFWEPAASLGIPPVLAALLILGGDAVPELVAVRK